MKLKRHQELQGKFANLVKSITVPIENSSDVASAIFSLFMGIGFTIYLFNSWYIAKDLTELSSPLYLTVVCFMSFNFTMRPVTSMLLGSKLSNHSMILQFLATFLILNVIENDWTSIIDAILSNQSLSIMIFAGVILAYAINYLMPIRVMYSNLGECRMAEAKLVKTQSSPFPTKRDINTASIHEAGHALVFAAAEGIPDSFKVTINDKSRLDSTLGQVSFARPGHLLNTGPELEFEILLKLGGLCAERTVFGEHADGGGSDIERYQSVARHYLNSGFSNLPYFNEPQTLLETEVNNQSINELKDAYTTKLVEFMDSNKILLVELSELLKEKKVLRKEDLMPFFGRATIPEWMPAVNFSE
ncbi:MULTISPECIES: hypothetical protein [Vibrio]|uniref:Peptidase M41 domain-containing protein n=1 Tax=Vibrio cholerae TaxID=666 RepID=A0A7Z7YE92_VIBCL|nr:MULTISPECIES: hypothetical protein [Vibrio]PNV69630.1 hypothetical protein C1Y48_17035 [Vibrio cholerae]TBM37300.1 hypothetical protein EYB64_19210 [Vibrio cholerae]BEI26314.1 hypothetical protein KKIDH5335_46460 [Vibrio fluvialis]